MEIWYSANTTCFSGTKKNRFFKQIQCLHYYANSSVCVLTIVNNNCKQMIRDFV